MKKILMALSAMAAITLAGCNMNNEPYATAGEDDYPRILNTDIEETTGGKPSSLPTISRDSNFEFEVIVTPVKYTTVSWYFDGEKVFEGNKIDMPFIAGDYEVKIVATTTKGKETYRNCTLKVLPLATDPVLNDGAKDRWLQFGTTVSVSGSNLEGIAKAYLRVPSGNGSHELLELGNLTVASDNISFDVPALHQEGDYKMILENADGEQFGCGLFGLHADGYVEPGIVEKVLWEGDRTINWGDSNVQLTPDMLAGVSVGATIVLGYQMIEADYHALRITNIDWSKDIVAQVDGIQDSYPESYEFEYTADVKSLVDGGAMVITGFGYKLTKVSYK